MGGVWGGGKKAEEINEHKWPAVKRSRGCQCSGGSTVNNIGVPGRAARGCWTYQADPFVRHTRV